MLIDADLIVQIRCAWNAWRTAEVHVDDLHDVHWHQPSGAPRPLLHAYVTCTNAIRTQIPHECDGSGAPHPLLVCVLKHGVLAPAYRELSRRASANAAGAPRPDGHPVRAPLPA